MLNIWIVRCPSSHKTIFLLCSGPPRNTHIVEVLLLLRGALSP
jgi:hypothetical protein